MTIWVAGTPIPQGSKTLGRRKDGSTFMRDGKGRQTRALKLWRATIATAAIAARMRKASGPVAVTLVFCLPRPQRPRHPHYHVTRPDVDKLTRAALDALTTIAWDDDSQVCRLDVSKQYDAAPGVRIAVEAL